MKVHQTNIQKLLSFWKLSTPLCTNIVRKKLKALLSIFFFLILLCCKPNIVSETCVVNAVKNVFIFSRTTSAIFEYYAFVDFKLTCNQNWFFFPFILRNKLLIHYGSVYIFIACCWTFVDIDIISANRQTRCKSFVNALSMKEKAFIECYAFKCKRCRVCFSKNLMVSHCFGAATHILSILVSAEAFFRIMRISNGCFANLYCKFRILTFLKHNSGCLGFFHFPWA